MTIIQRARMAGKTHRDMLDDVISGSFPRKSGYTTYTHLQHSVVLTNFANTDTDITNMVLNVQTYCSNLGDDAITFILENIMQFIALYNYHDTFLNTYSAEVKYSKLYTMLMSTHIYRELMDMEHNTPKVLSRKFRHIKEELRIYVSKRKEYVDDLFNVAGSLR